MNQSVDQWGVILSHASQCRSSMRTSLSYVVKHSSIANRTMGKEAGTFVESDVSFFHTVSWGWSPSSALDLKGSEHLFPERCNWEFICWHQDHSMTRLNLFHLRDHSTCTVSQAYFVLYETSHKVQNFKNFFGTKVTSEAVLSIYQILKVTRLQWGTQTKLCTCWRNFDLSRSFERFSGLVHGFAVLQ
jgi:hypothetical protein